MLNVFSCFCFFICLTNKQKIQTRFICEGVRDEDGEGEEERGWFVVGVAVGACGRGVRVRKGA